MLAELGLYYRMAKGIARIQKRPMCSDPEKVIRGRLLNREKTFLDVVQRAILSRADHPYSRMFQLAGCALGDLTRLVHDDGLDAALGQLRQEGVYLSHDEWKGKTPIVRSGREIPGGTRSFKNPLINGWLESSSSGSTGQPVLSSRSDEAVADGIVYHMIRAREFGTARSSWIDVKPILPAPIGLSSVLRAKRAGTPVEQWFSAGSAFREHGHYRMLTRVMVMIGNAYGAGAPYPDYLPYNDFEPVAEYVARRQAEGRECIVHGMASALVRVAAAAIEKGYDISGSIALCGGEALSPGKRSVFERAGVKAFSTYTMTEIGNIGFACRSMQGSCVHLFEDSVAVIGVQRPSTNPDDDSDLNSLHFTTLVPHAPNIFINVEMDDCGVVEPAPCDCAFSRAGFTRRINWITSFGKATPQGFTFHRTDLADVIERALPARLGGGAGDYQLVEVESSNGQTQLRLHVSARCGLTDSTHVAKVFLDIMRPLWGGALATREWSHAGGVEVFFVEPIATHSGKVHPVRLLGAYRQASERACAEARNG
jgi:hypothetical protein